MTETVDSVDVVVPFFNGANHVRPLLRTLDEHWDARQSVWLVNDGSDSQQREAIWETAQSLDHADRVHMIDNPSNLGFLATANRGIDAGTADVVILLNSDTLVTQGWIEGLIAALVSSDDVGVVCPLSSHANFTRFPIPNGSSFYEVAQTVRSSSERRYPEIGLASGFCFAAWRSLFEELEYLDPVYGRGYFEESDFCMRAMERGYRVIGDDGTFVFHQGWGTFGAEGRDKWMEANRDLFEQRWGRNHDYWRRRFLDDDPFGYLKEPVEDVLVGGSKPVSATMRSLGGPAWKSDTISWSDKVQESRPRGVTSVLFMLPGIGPYGGVISVIQIVNRLLLKGVRANIATHGPVHLERFRESLYFSPHIGSDLPSLAMSVPRYDLIVATRWDTVYDALLLAEAWDSSVLSFVQDFEPDFYPEGSAEREKAEISLRLIRNRVVKTRWLSEKVSAFGGSTFIIPLGLDLDTFYPADARSDREMRILSAARPGVEYRNLEGTLEVMRYLREMRPEVRPTFYGKPFEVEEGFHHLGILDQRGVAAALRHSRVVLDASLFQGFGRPGLEAMACGVPSVLTNRGGINEYATDGENCLQRDPYDVEGLAQAILELLDNEDLRRTIADGGIKTAQGYSADAEGERWFSLLQGAETSLRFVPY